MDSYMKMLKEELVSVKNIIDTKGIFDIDSLNFDSDFLNGFEYTVVLKDRSYFSVALGSTIFPNCNFDDIVYIRKRRGLDVSDNKTCLHCDSEIGNHNGDLISLRDEIIKKYNILIENEIETHKGVQ